jgi:hypothetical protein
MKVIKYIELKDIFILLLPVGRLVAAFKNHPRSFFYRVRFQLSSSWMFLHKMRLF